jgi:hypothetical protein
MNNNVQDLRSAVRRCPHHGPKFTFTRLQRASEKTKNVTQIASPSGPTRHMGPAAVLHSETGPIEVRDTAAAPPLASVAPSGTTPPSAAAAARVGGEQSAATSPRPRSSSPGSQTLSSM